MAPPNPVDLGLPYRVGESPIHGRGVFATAEIAEQTLIGRFEGPRTTRDGPHVLWVEDEDGTVYGIRGTNALRFLNHAANPNAELDGEDLWSLRTIPEGAEITIHYGPGWV